MTKKIAKISILIDGMTCASCEARIENRLRKLPGIEQVQVRYGDGQALIAYDPNLVSLSEIEATIESLGYEVRRPAAAGSPTRVSPVQDTADVRWIPASQTAARKPAPVKTTPTPRRTEQPGAAHSSVRQAIGVAIILIAVFVVLRQMGGLAIFNAFPQAEAGMGYGLLFVIGLLTSLHCVAMCGGINLSQCVPQAISNNQKPGQPAASSAAPSLRPSLLYNAGRVISYTVIGGIVGGLGSVISFSNQAKGMVAIVAGLFMVIMGLNMLNLFPWLRRFNPRMPRIFAQKIYASKESGNKGPLYIGLLNGLMPCGPLQAMQIYALSTGSPLKGALSMFLFSLGTVPLMFGLGAISTLLSKKFTHQMVRVSAMLVVVLGIFMFQNGLGLSGFGFNTLPSVQASSQSAAEMLKDVTIENGVQIVRSTVRSDSYDPITVQAGLPVRWTLVAEEGAINGCNNRIVIPAYDIEQPLAVGETVIEFTPEKAGNVAFSCWMGMIRSQIKVVAATTANPSTTANDASKTSADASLPASNDLAGTTASGTNPDESDAIQTAVIADNQQTATIQITASGYSPQVLVVQRGVPLKLTLDVQQITGCNNPLSIRPVVPGGSNDQNLTLDLKKNQTIPEFIPQDDFIVSCWMGMLTTYVKVVDDLGSADLAAIQDEVANSPAVTGGCCSIG